MSYSAIWLVELLYCIRYICRIVGSTQISGSTVAAKTRWCTSARKSSGFYNQQNSKLFSFNAKINTSYNTKRLPCSGEASPTILSCYANILVFTDYKNNQFLKKRIMIMIWNLHSMTKSSGWLRHCCHAWTYCIYRFANRLIDCETAQAGLLPHQIY